MLQNDMNSILSLVSKEIQEINESKQNDIRKSHKSKYYNREFTSLLFPQGIGIIKVKFLITKEVEPQQIQGT